MTTPATASSFGPPGDDRVARLRADMAARWQAGDRVPVEHYLDAHPDLSDEDALVLIVGEVMLRWERGDDPTPDEYAGRFPRLAAELPAQFDIQRLLRDQTGTPPLAPRASADGTHDFVPTDGSTAGATIDKTRPGSAAPAPPPPPGYEIVGELGRGGMGVVYHARQTLLNRPVALKVILAGAHSSAEDRVRFLAEAEAAAALAHPNIVRVYECGTHLGQPHLALEFCPGNTLAAKLRGTPLPPREAAEVVEALAQGMQAAHERGVVHRDLKPSNILLAADGTPKVCDFGLAKRVEGGGGLTQTGAILGTPPYMAPEQARGAKTVGPAADTYALGAILYECLTGRPPFLAATALDTIYQVLEQEPASVRSLNLQVPVDLETICHKCLQKEPPKRYASAAALADDLRRFLEGRPVAARPVGVAERMGRWCRRSPALAVALGAAAAALLLGTAVSITFGIRASEAAMREKDRADNEQKARRESQRLLGLMAVDQGLREADAGRLSMALLWMARALVVDPDDPDTEQMTRYRLAAHLRYPRPWPLLVQQWWYGSGIPNVAFDRPSRPSFSPDGRKVVTAGRDRTARVWDAITGQPLTPPLAHENMVWATAFSPDGRRVVTAGSGSDGTARIWDADTGQPLTPPLTHGEYVQHTAFSPDGLRVVTAGPKLARVWNVDTGRPVAPPLEFGAEGQYAALSTDGRRVATGNVKGGTAQVWDIENGRPLTPFLSHVTVDDPPDVQRAVAADLLDVQISRDGRRLLTYSRHAPTVRVWDVETGRQLGPPLDHTGDQRYGIRYAAFSPDGHRVVTANIEYEVRVWDADSGRPLTAHRADIHAPIPSDLQHEADINCAAFSPDGRMVVTACQDGTAWVWNYAAHWTLPLRHPHNVWYAAFSPDGRRVLTVSKESIVRIWDLVADRAVEQPVEKKILDDTPGHIRALSSDGNKKVIAIDKKLCINDTTTGRLLIVAMKDERGDVGEEMYGRGAFSADGRRVVMLGLDNTVRVWDSATGLPVVSAFTIAEYTNHVAISTDHRRIVTADINGAWVWDAGTGRPITPPLKHGNVRYVEFSPDGHRVVSAGADGTARVWDAETGQPVTPPLRHADSVRFAAFSADGRRVVSASEDGTARVWDAETGRPVTPSLLHKGVAGLPGHVEHAAFSADGLRVATLCREKEGKHLRVWDATTGRLLSPALKCSMSIPWQVRFTPDGNRLLVTSFEVAVEVWDISADVRPTAYLLGLAELLSGHRIGDTGGSTMLSGEELQARWADIRPRYPADFVVSPAAARAWREREIGDCLKEGNLDAAEFHKWWLVAEMVQAAQASSAPADVPKPPAKE